MSPSPAYRSPPTTVPTTNIIKNGIPLLPPIPAEPEASPSPPTSPILKPLRRPELQGIPGSSSFPINTQLYRLLSFPNPLSVQGFAASPAPICNIPSPALPCPLSATAHHRIPRPSPSATPCMKRPASRLQKKRKTWDQTRHALALELLTSKTARKK